MNSKRALFAGAVGIALTWALTAQAETASQATARAKAFLKQGNLGGALQAYTKAARADRTDQQLVQQAMLVRRAAILHQNLEKETNRQRWGQMAQALRSFYISQGALEQVVVLDEKVHTRFNTAASAAQLAETQLALNRNADAVEVLGTVEQNKTTTISQALLSIALARQGNVSKARDIAEAISLSTESGPTELYFVARMHAAVGNDGQALHLLTRCFEAVLPSRLDAMKTNATRSPEFVGLSKSEGFATALQTTSKVAESKCSGGSSCAGCPMRAKCAGSRGK